MMTRTRRRTTRRKKQKYKTFETTKLEKDKTNQLTEKRAKEKAQETCRGRNILGGRHRIPRKTQS